jgi:putative transposase
VFELLNRRRTLGVDETPKSPTWAKEYATMPKATENLVSFPQESAESVLDEILRDGAQQLLGRAIVDEVAAYIRAREDLVDAAGHRLVVRNGHLPERSIQTPLGEVSVKQPRVRDRREAGEREVFQSSILPPYLRKTKSLEDLLPWLYLKGISTGDFSEALQALLGPDAPGLSASTITRLKAGWEQEYKDWSKRSLESKHYVYLWADGVYFNVRLEDPGNARQCILVLMGATAEGKKELIAVSDGYRESEQSWYELLRDVNGHDLLRT